MCIRDSPTSYRVHCKALSAFLSIGAVEMIVDMLIINQLEHKYDKSVHSQTFETESNTCKMQHNYMFPSQTVPSLRTIKN